jgi:hypothetical protein
MLALPNRLKMIDPLSSPEAGQNRALFIKPVLWNDYSDGLANRLVRRVVEEALRTSIPAGDDAVQVLAYNRVVTRLDDGANPAQSLLAFAKRNFDLYTFGNIAIGFEHQAVTEQLHAALDDDFAAIFADVMQLA